MLKPYLALALGICAVSFAAILIRKAEAPSMVIAAYRLALASLVLAPLAAIRCRREIIGLPRKQWLMAAGAGAFLAIHFATWVTSLEFTTVASSVALVTTAPIWVAALSLALFREPVSTRTWAGIALAVAGGTLIGLGDIAVGDRALWGDLLALAGAWSGAGYFMIGRRLRPGLSLLAYIFLAYSSAAVILGAVGVVARLPLAGYSASTYLMFWLLAIGPQLLGHSSFNYALKFLSATFVTVTILAEPVGSTLLAVVLLNEFPQPLVVMGGVCILIGIAVAALGERRSAINRSSP